MLKDISSIKNCQVQIVPKEEFEKPTVNEQPNVFISTIGDYSSSDEAVNMFEVYFFVNGKYIKNLENYVMSYLIDYKAKAFTAKLGFCDDAKVDMNDIFGNATECEIMVFRINKQGEYIAQETLDCTADKPAIYSVINSSTYSSKYYKEKYVIFSFR